ncbi:MAG: hypothetical protein V4633_13405 [Pseudomonadota bacterium]
MGAFCVFGVSRQLCRKAAEKSVPTAAPVEPGQRRHELTAAEWGALVAVETARLFAESEKQVRISPELDAPQFCRDWIAASPGEVKLTKIMCRGDKIDKHGAVVMRDGAAVQSWHDYDPNAKPKIPAHPPQFQWATQQVQVR